MEVTITCTEPIIAVGNNPKGVKVVVSLPNYGNGDGTGNDGLSAYEVWLENGNTGSVDDYLDSLKGPAGKDAYEVWLDAGNVGDIDAYLDSLIGDKGDKGDVGDKGDKGDPGTPAVNNNLEMVRAANPTIQGDINANNHTVINIRNASAPQEPTSLNQLEAGVSDAKSYADGLVSQIFRAAGDHDASTGLFPTVGTGAVGALRRGDTFNVIVAGLMGGIFRDVGDSFYVKNAPPGQIATNWAKFETNTEQSTETVRGTAKVVTAAVISDENSTNDADIVTTKKLWLNFWQRVLALGWTWQAKQIFTLAPRFSSVNANEYLKSNATKDLVSVNTIPQSDITGLTSLLDLLLTFSSPLGEGLITGQYYDTALVGGASSTAAGIANRIDFAPPFFAKNDVAIDRIGVAVSTGVAGALVKLVIYSADANGWPDACLYESADCSAATTGVMAEAILAFTFTGKTKYWLGVRHSSTATIRTIAAASTPSYGFGTAAAATYNNKLSRARTFATPSTNPWAFTSADLAANNNPPSVRFRVV